MGPVWQGNCWIKAIVQGFEKAENRIGTRELNKILIGKTNRGWYLTNEMAIHRGKVVTIKKKLGTCTVEILWEK